VGSTTCGPNRLSQWLSRDEWDRSGSPVVPDRAMQFDAREGVPPNTRFQGGRRGFRRFPLPRSSDPRWSHGSNTAAVVHPSRSYPRPSPFGPPLSDGGHCRPVSPPTLSSLLSSLSPPPRSLSDPPNRPGSGSGVSSPPNGGLTRATRLLPGFRSPFESGSIGPILPFRVGRGPGGGERDPSAIAHSSGCTRIETQGARWLEKGMEAWEEEDDDVVQETKQPKEWGEGGGARRGHPRR